jgi:hypothetical protein
LQCRQTRSDLAFLRVTYCPWWFKAFWSHHPPLHLASQRVNLNIVTNENRKSKQECIR